MMDLFIALILGFSYWEDTQASRWMLFFIGMVTAFGLEDALTKFLRGQPLMTWNEVVYAASMFVVVIIMHIVGKKFKEFNRRP